MCALVDFREGLGQFRKILARINSAVSSYYICTVNTIKQKVSTSEAISSSVVCMGVCVCDGVFKSLTGHI